MSFYSKSSDGELADWNMAKATMIRMDGIMREIYRAYISNDGNSYYKNCMALYREIYSELTSTEKKACNEHINKCTLEKNKISNSPRRDRGITITPMLMQNLLNFELYIRECMGNHDLIIPHKDDPRMIGRRGRY